MISEVNKNYHYALAHGFTALGPAAGMLFSGKISTIWVDYLDKGLEPPSSIDYSSKLGSLMSICGHLLELTEPCTSFGLEIGGYPGGL